MSLRKTTADLDTSKKAGFTFIDLFAGCGGLSLGLMQAGWTGLFAVERDLHAFKSLHDNLIVGERSKFKWPAWLPKRAHTVSEVLEQHGIELLRLRGKVDMLVGGPPCQGFSSAGRRDANDPRNRLTEAYLKMVELVRPKVVLIENVKGITVDFESEGTGEQKVNYAKWIIDSLSARYVVTAQVLDLSSFGVPQKRRRFFIIGVRKDLLWNQDEKPFDLIEKVRSGFLREKGLSVPVSAKRAISDLEVDRNGTVPSRESAGFNEIDYKRPFTSYQRLMNAGVSGPMPDTRLARHHPDIASRFKELIVTCNLDGRLNVSISRELRASYGLKKCAIRVLDPDAPSPTITSMPDDLIHYSEPRALTVRENARLQSFPDWFAFKGKFTTGGHLRKVEVPRFTQVANAVPPLAAEAIGQALAQWLSMASTSP